jgi:hypothetical protein
LLLFIESSETMMCSESVENGVSRVAALNTRENESAQVVPDGCDLEN